MRRPTLIGLVAIVAACVQASPASSAPPSARGAQGADPAAPPPASVPHANTDLRKLLAGMASKHACGLVKDTFTGLAASDHPDQVTGNLWIRDCAITNDGTNVAFHFAADGWQWVESTQHAAGGTFAIHQYVPFQVEATLRGTVDFAYAPETHILTIWFKPKGEPQVTFKPLGKVAVDEEGTWSAIIGTLSSVVSKSPSQKATSEVAKKGQHSFASKLDKGMTITVDACTGAMRTKFGHEAAGRMAPPGLGQALKISAALHPNGILIIGPESNPRGLELKIAATAQPAHVEAVCMDDAPAIAEAFVAGKPPPKGKPLAETDVSRDGTLKVPPAKCRVAIVARSPGGTAVLSWTRLPPAESALIDCTKPGNQ